MAMKEKECEQAIDEIVQIMLRSLDQFPLKEREERLRNIKETLFSAGRSSRGSSERPSVAACYTQGGSRG
ncbi:MAG: hypothetical protein ACRD5G_07585 [Candidatus Acidiferrales bacterium]